MPNIMPSVLYCLSSNDVTFRTHYTTSSSMDVKGQTILVTGASSGLGYEMAYQLAVNEGANLVIVARRAEKLAALQAAIAQKTSVQVDVVAADLGREEDVARVVDHCLSISTFRGAILNAGITYFGKHHQLEWDYFQKMVQLNVMSVVRMTNTFLQHFEGLQQPARIMIVSSMASLFPVPYQAAYSGTKGFLTNFANALSQEVTNKQLRICAYCPGGIKTEMTTADGKFDTLSRWLEPVDKVASQGIYAYKNGKLTYVPGLLNKLSIVIGKFVPRSILLRQTGKIYRGAVDDFAD